MRLDSIWLSFTDLCSIIDCVVVDDNFVNATKLAKVFILL